MFRKVSCAVALLSASFLPGICAAAQQPDKLLYDKAIADIQKKRFEVARLALQTLINTYDSSEFLPKAYLAIAESWHKQGGARELAQARKEYSQVLLLFPQSPEAKAAQKMLQKLDKPAGNK
jgi:outer membrane protein assembly factor BamD